MTVIAGLKLSPLQQHLWLLAKSDPSYRVQCALGFDGVAPEALERGLEALVARHEILRTVFASRPGMRFPIQVVTEVQPALDWQRYDLGAVTAEDLNAELELILAREREAAVDLESGPVLRAALIGLPQAATVLTLTLPAILVDGHSLMNLTHELVRVLAGRSEEEEPVQYFEYSEWLAELLEGEDAQEGVAFWRRQFQDELPATRVPGQSAETEWRPLEPGMIAQRLDAATAKRLTSRAAAEEVTLEDFLLAAWSVFLYRLGGEPEVALALAVDGRKDEELEAAVGPYTRYLPLRCRFEGDLSFPTALKRVTLAAQQARDWQEFYLPQALDASLPEVGFDFRIWPGVGQGSGAGVRVLARSACSERLGLRLSVWGLQDEALYLEFHFAQQRFAERDVGRLASHFRVWIEGILEHPAATIDELELLDAEERRRLLIDCNARGNAGVAEDFLAVHRMFEQAAARCPEAVAVRCEEHFVSYEELERRSAGLAAVLRQRGVGPEALVAVCLGRSVEMIVAVLAVLKAGGGFLPLDPDYPAERLAYLLDDAAPSIVLTRRELLPVLGENAAPRLMVDEAGWTNATESSAEVPPAALAYVIYTSGSTGRPKGVGVSYSALSHYLRWCHESYPLTPGGVTPVHSPIGFDLTLTSIFAPLTAGGTALLLPESRGFEALSEALVHIPACDLVKLTPSHLALLALAGIAGSAPPPKAVILGGEALYGEDLESWQKHWPQTRMINEYGPTETVVGCSVYEADGTVSGAVPIGQPITGICMHVLDRRLRPVPAGVVGELYIGGSGVSRGYLRRPAATAEKFVPDPFVGERKEAGSAPASPGGRLYRSGDLARYRSDGELEFLGRVDHQVKVRGFRVELGEIEAVLSGHSGVRECVVVARDDLQTSLLHGSRGRGDRSGSIQVVAYVVPDKARKPNHSELRDFLATTLPEHMIPAAFVMMEILPLTAHGKVDRSALPRPSADRPDLREAYVEPRSDVERQLAAIWSEVLGLEKIGVNDRFFALGGDSIRSVRLVALAQKQGLDFTVPDLFEHQTIALLAAHVERTTRPEVPAEEDDALAELLDELESLSDEEAIRRLEKQAG